MGFNWRGRGLAQGIDAGVLNSHNGRTCQWNTLHPSPMHPLLVLFLHLQQPNSPVSLSGRAARTRGQQTCVPPGISFCIAVCKSSFGVSLSGIGDALKFKEDLQNLSVGHFHAQNFSIDAAQPAQRNLNSTGNAGEMALHRVRLRTILRQPLSLQRPRLHLRGLLRR